MTDPRFNDEFWRNEIETMIQINKKAEQQALAKYGLDYVTDTYLPEKLGTLGFMCSTISWRFVEDGTEDGLPGASRAEDHDVSEERVVREDHGYLRSVHRFRSGAA